MEASSDIYNPVCNVTSRKTLTLMRRQSYGLYLLVDYV